MVGGLQMANLVYQSFTQALDAHFDWWLALSSGIGCDPTAPNSENCTTTYNSNGWNDGLARILTQQVYYDPNYATNGNYALYTTKRYFVMKHLSQFIEYGAVRYDVDVESGNAPSSLALRVLAFKTGDDNNEGDSGKASVDKKSIANGGSGWTILLMNLGPTEISVDLPGNIGRLKRVVRTSPEEDWADLSNYDTVLPALSTTTIITDL
ncbi:hypothetical protein Clacol_009537 [Clathrus columnatus]|uniref:Uncharacterized protein n=1 Tax=Clathrus columnatus TaxID=1419009 RepID=A0AAV5ASE1_9AGAM|nr:hypothetical protein Clacol_009537 [Clathrus columnatus]